MKELLINIAVGSLSLSVLMLLAPSKEKTLKYVISVVFLCMINLPIIKALPVLYDANIKSEQIDVKENVLKIKSASLKQLIADILKKNNIKFKDISINANILEDYSITIKRVKIISNHKKQEILNALKELEFEKVVQSYEE